VVRDAVKKLTLIYEHILLFEQDTISRDAITGFKLDDITDDEVGCGYLLSSTVLAADNSGLGVKGLSVKSQELRVFTVCADRLYYRDKKHSGEDRDALEPLVGLAAEKRQEQ
jgi:hypothetical protein